jgi:hypothetical protein
VDDILNAKYISPWEIMDENCNNKVNSNCFTDLTKSNPCPTGPQYVCDL